MIIKYMMIAGHMVVRDIFRCHQCKTCKMGAESNSRHCGITLNA